MIYWYLKHTHKCWLWLEIASNNSEVVDDELQAKLSSNVAPVEEPKEDKDEEPPEEEEETEEEKKKKQLLV